MGLMWIVDAFPRQARLKVPTSDDEGAYPFRFPLQIEPPFS
jgi:hypothetical protein